MDLARLETYKENNRLEAKAAQGGLPKSIWETISAFANTEGGVIVLGAKERRDGTLEVAGLDDADKMLDDFWNTAHNIDKLSCCVISDRNTRIESVDDKELIVIEVSRADRRMRPVYVNGNPITGTYRRDHKGDYRCAQNEIQAMYRDASDESVDTRVHENLTVDDLSAETIGSYRRSYELHHSSHAWADLPNEEFLCRIGAAKVGDNGKVHPTSAGLLMFGEEWRIMAEFPHYFLDYRQEFGADERWQGRITSQDDSWSGNVFDFYKRVFNNMKQAINVPFKLDRNSERIDETEAHDALREAIANCLTNADYSERRGVVFLWKEDGLHFSNPGGFRVGLENAYVGGNSDPRIEMMMKMFTLISIGERAGGGIPDMVKKWTSVGYRKPMLSEQVNPERSSIFLPLEVDKDPNSFAHAESTNLNLLTHGDMSALLSDSDVQLSDNECIAFQLAIEQGRVTTAMLSEDAGISKLTANRTLKHLADIEVLTWRGRNKTDPSQYYEISKKLLS
ncbi:putative DNA binding domain-containing protein [Collinsella sp. zg1085]|uniref:RNA-binding domain-containing protein n=1 Tax=Collinsella sp. zg1085 TaxID=2844380 RepID=UPI001C0D8B87|nr:RNA-binding domain-containing protein [Collinsella sp. zg1085]QWT17548.1 putative DNA binding domain-containing protein [Collinsella sp. zg1085]